MSVEHESGNPKPSDPFARTRRELEAQRAEQARVHSKDRILHDHRRRVIRALDAAQSFPTTTPRSYNTLAPLWARHWVHAARTVRHYERLRTLEGIFLPDDAGYRYAKVLFEKALDRCTVKRKE